MRKILAALATVKSVKPIATTTPRRISHQGRPGGIAIRSIINIGVAGGKRDIQRAKAPVGD